MNTTDVNGELYSPFYTILIETDVLPENFSKYPDIKKTLSHEYLHYIQDLSLTFNFIYATHTYSKIAHFYNSKRKRITLPYRISIRHFKSIVNEKLFSIYLQGYKKEDRTSFPNWTQDFSVKIQEEKPKDFLLKILFPKLKQYYIELSANQNYKKKIYFGALAIMEGMTSIFENHLYPSQQQNSNSYLLPYDLPYIVANSIYPIIANNKVFLFAVCEGALMFYDPATIFIYILKKMQSVHFNPQNVSEVYSFIYSEIKFKHMSLYSIWKKTFTQFNKNLKNICNFKEIEYAKRQTINSYSLFFRKRITTPEFLANMLYQTPAIARSNYNQLMMSTYSPVILNTNNFSGFMGIPPTNQTDYYSIFHWNNVRLMYKYIFDSEGDVCPFCDSCPFENDCDYIFEPYNKPKKHPFCNFLQYSQSFGLYKHKVIIKRQDIINNTEKEI